MAEKVRAGLTYWMRPPQGAQTDDGLLPGDEDYVDPHANAMEQWRGIAAREYGDQSGLSAVGGGYGKKRKGEESRGQMNLTGSQGSSILTSKPIG